jgi:hypothetical protein
MPRMMHSFVDRYNRSELRGAEARHANFKEAVDEAVQNWDQLDTDVKELREALHAGA